MSIMPRTHCDPWHCINKWAVTDNDRLKNETLLVGAALVEAQKQRDAALAEVAALRKTLVGLRATICERKGHVHWTAGAGGASCACVACDLLRAIDSVAGIVPISCAPASGKP